MSPRTPSALHTRTLIVVVLLVLAAAVPTAVAALDTTATPSADTTEPRNGSTTVWLPPRGTGMAEVPAAADAGTLASTDAVRPNGTVVFRLNATAVPGSPDDRTLGDGVRFEMHQTDRSTPPSRMPLQLDTTASGDAVRTFAVDGDQYVAVDLGNATWGYDQDPGTHTLEPETRVGQAFDVTLAVSSNGSTVSGNTTITLTDPGIVGDVAVAAGDVAELNVSVAGGWTATLVIGNESGGYRVARRVVDGNADGHVLVEFDTGAVGTDAAFSAVGPDTVEPHPRRESFDLRNGTLTPGNYPLAAGLEEPETLAREHRSWESRLVVEATPTPATATATEPSTTTATERPTGSATPAPTDPPARSTTDSPGFGPVAALLAVAASVAARAR